MTDSTDIHVTKRARAVLRAIAAGMATREQIAEELDVALPVVTGCLVALSRNGLIEIFQEDGRISLTGAAARFVTWRAPRTPRD